MKQILKLSSLFCLLLLPFLSLQAQNCNCGESFVKAVEAYEENYSLFIYKVTDDNRNLYKAHTDLMRQNAKEITSKIECKSIIEQWLQFFRDGHTYILNSTEPETYNENFKITEKQFKEDFVNKNYSLNPLLGIWENGDYTVAIIPNQKDSKRERDYIGVLLKNANADWKENEVKFEMIANFGTSYQINYMLGDHSLKKTTAEQINNSLIEISDLSSWRKIWPKVGNEKPSNEIELKNKEFHLSYIDDIPYLRLPDFYSVERSYVDSIMQSQHEKIINSEFMIIDVRGNGGGNDATYFPVLPYVLSGPIELPTSGFWLSKYNIQMVMDYKTGNPDKKVSEYTKEEKEDYDLMMANIGTAYFDYPEDTFTFNADTLYSGPKKVILLTDEETASSGETFVYRTNQSEKVIVYGQNTAGVVDGFNGISKDIGCFEVVSPSSYRAKDIKENPIDPYGIAPDVYVDKKDDVLSYAIKHMKQLIKNENN